MIGRSSKIKKLLIATEAKIYFGCGNIRQTNYINIDIRKTPAVDIVADLKWCTTHLHEKCQEVYLSHVLEHFSYPGKAMRDNENSVLWVLNCINRMLKSNGIVRLAVPDLGVLAKLYVEGKYPLYPRISGRLFGEQNYPENTHKCLFDREFLELCLKKSGFSKVREWDPEGTELTQDASFDNLDGVRTSLNLVAAKP